MFLNCFMFLLFNIVPNFCTNVFYCSWLNKADLPMLIIISCLTKYMFLVLWCLFLFPNSFIFVPTLQLFLCPVLYFCFFLNSCVKNYVPSSLIFVPNSCLLILFSKFITCLLFLFSFLFLTLCPLILNPCPKYLILFLIP